jgi:hypothetical protein
MKGLLLCLLLVLLAVVPATRATATSLVLNGGFESGDFTGWTRSGDLGFSGVDGNPHTGTHAAYFGPTIGFGYLSQMFVTDAAHDYLLDFWMANRGMNITQVFWGDTMLLDTVLPNQPYTHYVFDDLDAAGPTTRLMFAFSNLPEYTWLDDVAVEAVQTVPEPGSLALLAGGLAFGGLFLLRRRSMT